MIRAKKGTPRVASALRCRLRSIAAAVSVLLASAAMAHAQVPAAPPPGMTQEQFDSLVDAISNSVTEKLKAAGPAAQPKAGKGAPAAKPKIVITAIDDEPDEFGLFFGRAKGVAIHRLVGRRMTSRKTIRSRTPGDGAIHHPIRRMS